MSANACLLFVGLRYEIPTDEMEELLEKEQDPRLRAAQRANLDIFWANFGGAGERYLLFVGK